MKTSTLEDVISCRAPKCVVDAKIHTVQFKNYCLVNIDLQLQSSIPHHITQNEVL